MDEFIKESIIENTTANLQILRVKGTLSQAKLTEIVDVSEPDSIKEGKND